MSTSVGNGDQHADQMVVSTNHIRNWTPTQCNLNEPKAHKKYTGTTFGIYKQK